MKSKVVFFGSPDFALPTLEALYQHFSVIGVVTQPDKPAGSGRMLTAPPDKRLAEVIWNSRDTTIPFERTWLS